jgi:hypothetical protein
MIWLGFKWLWDKFMNGGLNTLAGIYAKYKDSAIESERIKASLVLKQMEAIVQVRIATAGFWEMRLATALIAYPFIFHFISVWLDTQFKLGWKIDAFPSPFNEWQGVILLSFFGISVASKIGTGVVSAIFTSRK